MLAALALLVLQAPAGPRSLGWDDFPVFVWREEHAEKPLPPELVEPFGGVILMRGEDSAWARERGLAYLVWNVAGREIFHLDADEAWRARVERWIETKDEALLVREPCLNDPATLQRAFATLETTLAKHGEHPGLAFVLGDEVGLTPNGSPFDLCRCGHCEERWRAYAEPRKLPARAPLTDEVLADLEGDDFSTLGAWLARRRFDRREFEHSLLRVRERILGFEDPGPRAAGGEPSYHWPERRPDAPLVALLGMKGPTAFGGLGPSPELFDAVEFYAVGEGREVLGASDYLHRLGQGATFGPPREPRAALTTVFLGEESPAGAAWKLWEHWLRGGHGAVLWSDQVLRESPAHRTRLAEVVRTLRTFEPARRELARHGCALVYDLDSVAASFLRDARDDGATWPRRTAGYQAQHGTRERKVETWLRLLEDCGELPAALPLERVGEEAPFPFQLLLLPELLVLAPEDVERLRRLVEQGVTLVVDGTLGWVDREGRPWREDAFTRLSANHPERVLRSPASVSDYLDERLSPAKTVQARNFVTRLIASSRKKARISLPTGLDPSLPWLVGQGCWIDSKDPHRFVTLLPNFARVQDRARLRDVQLPELAPDEGEWLYPTGGGVLRAGDAAILRLARSCSD